METIEKIFTSLLIKIRTFLMKKIMHFSVWMQSQERKIRIPQTQILTLQNFYVNLSGDLKKLRYLQAELIIQNTMPSISTWLGSLCGLRVALQIWMKAMSLQTGIRLKSLHKRLVENVKKYSIWYIRNNPYIA
mgnify:CR=1 FL=1